MIASIQKQLGVVADGIWGKQSQNAFETKEIKLDFDYMRTQLGSFTQSQVNGFNTIIKAINEDKRVKQPMYIAYILATVWHETAKTMQPIEEYGKGKGRKYGKNIDIDGSRYLNLPHLYYGRGYIQLTWLTNYKKMKDKLGVDLVNNPSLALDPVIATKIMIEGMLSGDFTGKSLKDSFKTNTPDEFINARRIINGLDKAKTIGYLAEVFLKAIKVV